MTDFSAAAPATALSRTQSQTKSAFGYQWQMREAFESDAVQAQTRGWLIERYCGGDPSVLAGWLSGGRKRIMDAGCGAGLSAMAFFADHLHRHDYLGVDISDQAIATARRRFAEQAFPGEFLEASVSDVDVPDGSFDLIFSEGVLHHTDDTAAAFYHLSSKLAPGGRFLFYVYARKAALREFADDHIRAKLQDMTDDEAWEALKPLTKLGEALGKLEVNVTVPEDIPYLGIKKGELDIQRFIYWNVCKLFFRDDYTLDEMNHVNFDWYRPLNCHRHAQDEVEGWCRTAGFDLESVRVEEAGITVIARKPLDRHS